MGVAWFDDSTRSKEPSALRTGGLPCLDDGTPWPECPRCDVPMLFRAQLPLGLTSLVAPDDPRILLIFECHSRDAESACDTGTVIVSHAGSHERAAPAVRSYNVVVDSSGADAAAVATIAASLCDENEPPSIPGTLLFAQPLSIAEQAQKLLETSGAKVRLLPAAPVTLTAAHDGMLVPFDEGMPGMTKTTLPPLSSLVEGVTRRRIRALLGGATPGHRDLQLSCACGKPTKTVIRLLASASDPEVTLGSAIVQICLACNTGSLHRSS